MSVLRPNVARGQGCAKNEPSGARRQEWPAGTLQALMLVLPGPSVVTLPVPQGAQGTPVAEVYAATPALKEPTGQSCTEAWPGAPPGAAW